MLIPNIVTIFVKYGNSNSGITRAKVAGAKFIKRTAGYSSIDSRRSENILKDLYIDSPGKKMAQ